MVLSLSISSKRAGTDPPCWCRPQLPCLLHHTLLPPPVHHPPPVNPGVFLFLLLLSAGCCCLLRPATHAPILFRQDTNLQTLLALRSNLSGQGISCPMCSGVRLSHIPLVFVRCLFSSSRVAWHPAGVFMEKPHPLYIHTPSFKFSTHPQSQGTSNVRRSSARLDSSNETSKTTSAHKPPTLSLSALFLLICCSFFCEVSLLTVYISKLDLGTSTTLYRFSLNTSVPSPWKPCSTDPQEVASFQVSESKAITF